MPNLTTSDLEQSATGRQIIAEVEAEKTGKILSAKREQHRQERIDRCTEELLETCAHYSALKDDAINLVEELDAHTERLGVLKNRLRELLSLLNKNDAEIPRVVPLPLAGQPKREIVLALTKIRQQLPARI
jgi:hypothetical protein